MLYTRKDSANFKGPSFLAVEWFGSVPTPSPPSPFRKLDRRHTGRLRKRDNLLKGWGGGGEGAGSRIIRPQESLVLYKSFNPLCSTYTSGVLMATHRKTEKERQFAEKRGAWSRIIRPQESLVLFKSFNPVCSTLSEFLMEWPGKKSYIPESWNTRIFILKARGGRSAYEFR